MSPDDASSATTPKEQTLGHQTGGNSQRRENMARRSGRGAYKVSGLRTRPRRCCLHDFRKKFATPALQKQLAACRQLRADRVQNIAAAKWHPLYTHVRWQAADLTFFGGRMNPKKGLWWFVYLKRVTVA